ncbi:hypothetical protein PZA11_008008 [Diplocarpon coronariae]
MASDALRLYLINSPVVRAEPLRFKEAGERGCRQSPTLPLWNSYKFFEDKVALLRRSKTSNAASIQLQRLPTQILQRYAGPLVLKTPLKSLVVIHPDPEYLEDVRSLNGYITEELNIQELILSSDEAKYNVQYSVTADWPILGKKLKKDVQKVKKALPGLTSSQTIIVDGITLEDGDLVVKRGLKDEESSKKLETNTDDDVLIILDAEIYPELADQALARERSSTVFSDSGKKQDFSQQTTLKWNTEYCPTLITSVLRVLLQVSREPSRKPCDAQLIITYCQRMRVQSQQNRGRYHLRRGAGDLKKLCFY